VIVVDVNVVAYTLIEGDWTVDAKRLRTLDPHWRLPRLWRYEFVNLLATYRRAGGMSEPRARDLLRAALAYYGPAELEPDQDAVLQAASQHRITGYDAEYVALALRLGVKLVTEDEPLRRAVPGAAISIKGAIARALPPPS